MLKKDVEEMPRGFFMRIYKEDERMLEELVSTYPAVPVKSKRCVNKTVPMPQAEVMRKALKRLWHLRCNKRKKTA